MIVPFYNTPEFVEQMAFSMWHYDVHEAPGGWHPGSWNVVRGRYVAKARAVAKDMDRAPGQIGTAEKDDGPKSHGLGWRA